MHYINTFDKFLLDLTNGRCFYCGCELDINNYRSPNSFCREHIIPKIYGGNKIYGNIVPSCKNCNGIKRTKSLPEFRRRMTELSCNIPHFNDEQYIWLESNGFDFSEYKPYEFYFEKIGLFK